MYETLKRLYNTGRATAAGLKKAVANGWITQKEYEKITGEEKK